MTSDDTASNESVGRPVDHEPNISEYSALICASCPPPVAGQSLATEMLLDALKVAGVPHAVVDLSRQFYGKNIRIERLRRLLRVASLGPELALRSFGMKSPTVFYLQLGQSPESLMRDLPLLEVAAMRRLPSVLHVHGGAFRSAFDELPPLIQRRLASHLQRAHTVIVLTQSLRRMFQGLVSEERIVVVENGVPREVSEAAQRLRATQRRDSTREFRVLFLSNLIASKGYSTVLEAARLARDAGYPLRFLLAGLKTEETDVDPESFIREHRLANIEYLGPVYGDDKNALLASADAFVLPTEYPVEGQPLAVLEALVFGVPVITTRQGGLADTIREGETGSLIQPRDPEGLLDSVVHLINSDALYERMSSSARRDAEERFSHTAHSFRMLQVLSATAGSRLS